MSKRWSILIFAAGLSVGWLTRGQVRETGKAELSSSSPAKTARTRQPKVNHETKWQTLGKRVKDLNSDDKESFLKELTPLDRIPALEALAAQAGIDGLEYQVKSMLEEILRTWANDDFEGAWSWCEINPNEASKRYLMRFLLDILAQKDPAKAFALHSKQLALYPDFQSSAPAQMLKASVKSGTADFLAFLEQSQFGGGTSGLSTEFAEDFDFQQAAEGLAKLIKDRHRLRPPEFPDNFYTEWSKRDYETAYSWWAANVSLPFNDINDILDVIETRNPGGSGSWLATKLQASGVPRDKIIRELEVGQERVNAVNAIAQALPDAQSGDAFLTEFLIEHDLGYRTEEFEGIVSGISSPRSRLAAFQQMKDKGNYVNLEKIGDARLQTWGVTRQQMLQFFPPRNEPQLLPFPQKN